MVEINENAVIISKIVEDTLTPSGDSPFVFANSSAAGCRYALGLAVRVQNLTMKDEESKIGSAIKMIT